MKVIPLALFVLLSCRLTEQKPVCNYITVYYPLIYQADLAYEMNDYKKAYDLYHRAFKVCNPINTYTHNELGKYAEVCAQLGLHEEALAFIELDLRKGFELKWLLADSLFTKTFDTRAGKKLIGRYDKIRADFLNQVDLKLREEILQRTRADQRFRTPYNRAKADSVDKLNAKRLIELFETIGYPAEPRLGHGSIDGEHADIHTMLLHTGDSIRLNYFIPKLKEFVKAGACSPIILGNLIDQYHIYHGKPQTHGTYSGQQSKYAEMINRAEVNKNRLSIGLPTLELQEKTDSVKALKYPWMRF